MTKKECKELIEKLPDSISENEKREIQKILKRINERFFNTSSENKKIVFDEDQLIAINSKSKNILLKARAGSGKTAVLVERAKRLLNNREKVLLLAFNKKASLEMKKRLGNGFQNSKTFHSFASSIVKSKDNILMDRELLLYIQNFIPKSQLSKIGNDEISQKKESLSPDYFVKYIRNRSDYSLSGDKIKSKGEKLIANFLFEHDKKSLEIPTIDPENNREEFEKILKSKLQKSGIKLKKLSDSEIENRVLANFPTIYKTTERIEKYISIAKSKNWKPEKLDQKIQNFSEEREFLKLANSVYKRYEDSNKTDFNDLLIRATQKVSKLNLDHILIDEFQDFNPLFNGLIQRVLELNPKINIFAVGDDWQGINGFAGADLKYFINFNEYFDNPEILKMRKNYRSRKAIVDFGNKIMSASEDEKAISVLDGGEIIENNKFPKDRDLTFITRSNSEKSKFQDKNITEKITAHKSKGLQFDEVLLQKDSFENNKTHSENRFFKIFGKTDDEIKAEEKRLFYVAITRAKDKLYLI
ncbi:ATP-dependent exonuclase V beta subunit, helicase and exonuclease domain-containing [Thiovulum sp. ES]|nr:ATP-dependent exonuclase V beta subunit, helicase and exonuclease domain-containing [Thiovulum sp. ES]